MTNAKFVEKLLGIELSYNITDPDDKCTGLRCPDYVNLDTDCEIQCPHCNFWHKEIDIARIGANIVTMPELSKAFLNSMFGQSVVKAMPTYLDTDSIKMDTFYAEYKENISEGWQTLPLLLKYHSFDDIVEILEDAKSNGFQVSIRNSVIYFKEDV